MEFDVQFIKDHLSSNINDDLLYDKVYRNMKNSKNKYVNKVYSISKTCFTGTEFYRVLEIITDNIYDDFAIENKSDSITNLISAHVFELTDYLSKELFKNMNFCDMLYKHFLSDYLKLNKNFIREVVTNHTDLAAIIEPFFTGLFVFFKSEEYAKILKKLFFNSSRHCVLNIHIKNRHMSDSVLNLTHFFIENIKYTNNIPEKCIESIKYKNDLFLHCFRKAMSIISVCALFCIVRNHERYPYLHDIITDCIMTMVTNAKTVNSELKSTEICKNKMNEIMKKITNKDDDNVDFSITVSELLKELYTDRRDGSIMFNINRILEEENVSPKTSPDFNIDKEFYMNKIYGNKILQYTIDWQLKYYSDQLNVYMNYNINDHFKDLLYLDPLYLFYNDTVLKINNEKENIWKLKK